LFFTDCPTLPEVDFATLTPDGASLNPSSIGTDATYTCDTGYHIEGDITTTFTLTCVGAIAMWNPGPNVFPTCVRGITVVTFLSLSIIYFL